MSKTALFPWSCSRWLHLTRGCYDCNSDPFDCSQRAFVFMATLVISLTVSLFLFRSPKPECSEVCTQQDQTGQTECEVVCEDSATDGLYATVVSAASKIHRHSSLTAAIRQPNVSARDSTNSDATIAHSHSSAGDVRHGVVWLATQTCHYACGTLHGPWPRLWTFGLGS